MVIREEEVDIIKENDQKVIINQIIKISHIMSDNLQSIYSKRCIIDSEFIMDKNICVTFIYLQNCFTKELIIQLKIILEKITQVDVDITLIIENCRRRQHNCIIDIVDFINITEKKHIIHPEEEPRIYLEENIMKHMPNISQYSKGPSSSFLNDLITSKGIRGSHLRAYIRKVIIKSDIVLDVFNILGHLAQRGHQTPTILQLDSIIEHQLLDFTSISGPNFFSVPSAINIDIMVIMEKLIGVTHPWYTYHTYIFDMNDIIRSESSAEYHLLDYTSISRFNYSAPICVKAELINKDIFAEYHLLDYICINGPNHISVNRVINLDINIKAERFIRTICPSHINLLINIYKVEPCLSHHNGDISHIGYDFNISHFSIYMSIKKKKKFISIIFMPYINLSYNDLDLNIEAERFIRNHRYANSVKSINREVPSEDHITYGKFIRIDSIILESIDESIPYVHQHPHLFHHEASSMNTSGKHIICVQCIMEDIYTSSDLTVICVFISKYFILNESIIDNYFHIILVALHQWEALDIIHSCSSGNRTRWSHLIEWKKTNHHIIIKNIDCRSITHQESNCFINHHCIYMKKGYIVIHDIAADLSSRIITKDLSIIDTIIYDTITHHISIYDSFGTIIVDDIDLTSMMKEYILITFVDFMKHSSVHIDLVSSEDIIVLDNVIIEKRDIINWTDVKLDIKSFIINYNLNNHQHFSNILQKDSVIVNYLILTNIYDTYHLLISSIDISNHNLIMVGIMDHHFDQTIIDPVISIQLCEQSQLNIIHFIDIASNIYYGLEFNIEHFINHLGNYSTYHIKAYFIFDITLVITYLNQLINELYSTITETKIIKNVYSDETSYMDIMTSELYITISDMDISVYPIINIGKDINSIEGTRVIIAVKTKPNIVIVKINSVFIKEETSSSWRT